MITALMQGEKKMDDLISRKAAIDALRAMQTYKLFAGDDLLLIDQAGAQTELMMLPPAQPEWKRGKWEIYVISMLDGEGCRCSECGLEGVPYWDFCPNCGARMEK